MQRILGGESLPLCSNLSLFVENLQGSPFNLESKLWKLALLIASLDQKTQSHLDLSDITGSNQTGCKRLTPKSKSIFSNEKKDRELV